MIDVAATRESFAEFMASEERSAEYVRKRFRHFDEKKFPLIWVLCSVVMILTLVAIPAGIIMLYFAFKNRKTPRQVFLHEIETLPIIQTFVVVANTDVAEPSNVGAALVVGSFDDPSPTLEQTCRSVTSKLQDLFSNGGVTDAEDAELFQVVADERVRRSRRRIPTKYSGDHKLFAHHAYVDQNTIGYDRDPCEVIVVADDILGDLQPVPLECVRRK